MRVLIIAPGTRGDVAPLASLGNMLIPLGFEVAIAANPAYSELVTAAGCEYRVLPGDMSALVTPAPPGQKPTRSDLQRYFSELGEYMQLAANGTLAAAQAGADIILANSISPYAYDIAEALSIPAIGTHLQPVEPSAAYPPVVLGSARSLGPVGNKLLGSLITNSKAPYDAPTAKLRQELGLNPRTRAASDRARRKANNPILHGFSKHVVPRPKDWHSGLEMTGYWWSAAAENFTPDPKLEQFLADGPPPVFIGFGSSNAMDAQFMLDAVRQSGVRAVLQGVDGVEESDALSIGSVPHQWLFPQMDSVVHHAGAGTTAAGLRAGVPTVAVPIFTDQPFWGAQILRLGAGPKPVPYKDLSVDSLATAITQSVSEPGFTQSAKRISSLLETEDSVAPVVRALRTARLKQT